MPQPADTYKPKKERQDRRTTRKANQGRKTSHGLDYFKSTDQAEIDHKEQPK